MFFKLLFTIIRDVKMVRQGGVEPSHLPLRRRLFYPLNYWQCFYDNYFITSISLLYFLRILSILQFYKLITFDFSKILLFVYLAQKVFLSKQYFQLENEKKPSTTYYKKHILHFAPISSFFCCSIQLSYGQASNPCSFHISVQV